MQVLQKRLRRLNDDLKREVAAELDGLAAQVYITTHACPYIRLLADFSQSEILGLSNFGCKMHPVH